MHGLATMRVDKPQGIGEVLHEPYDGFLTRRRHITPQERDIEAQPANEQCTFYLCANVWFAYRRIRGGRVIASCETHFTNALVKYPATRNSGSHQWVYRDGRSNVPSTQNSRIITK